MSQVSRANSSPSGALFVRKNEIYLCSHIAKFLLEAGHRVQLSSRNPERILPRFQRTLTPSPQLSLVPADVTKYSSLQSVFEDADLVVSLVGVMHGSPKKFEDIQVHGATNVAKAAQRVNAKLIHFSAIGADANSSIPYARTKALGEAAALKHCSRVTIIRPSLVFGPEDDFFNRFARLSKYLPFLPVFGGGRSRFQPVFVDDIARAVEVLSRKEEVVETLTNRKIIEAGGPDVFTYREMMQLVLKYRHRRRPIVSLPFSAGLAVGLVSEQLPVNLFTITRAQVQQLKSDNVVSAIKSEDHFPFRKLLEDFASQSLTSLGTALPTYL